MQTKRDFTVLSGCLLVLSIILPVFGILTIIFPSRLASLAYSALGALLFSVYLVCDVQMIMGGQHKYSIAADEYILAALTVYLDIINLLLRFINLIHQVTISK